MTDELQQTEEEIEAGMAALLASQGAQLDEVPEVTDKPDDDAPEEQVEVQPADDEIEARAKAEGHVPYDEWVRSGKDPKAWRPADEYVRRGELLKTPKPDLIERVEKLSRAQEETARLMAEQIRISREAQDKARIEGYQQAIADAKEEQERAFAVGDREAHREAILKEQQAQQAMQQAQQPQQDPELLRWQDEAKWFKDGFTVDPYTQRQVPKNAAVETFLVYQKNYMLENPGARLIDSVRFAETKVKAVMPDFFRPKTVQNRITTQVVEGGQRQVARKPDPLAKYGAAEQDLIKRAAKTFGISVADYVKQIEG